jgi:hypothetical protein
MCASLTAYTRVLMPISVRITFIATLVGALSRLAGSIPMGTDKPLCTH